MYCGNLNRIIPIRIIKSIRQKRGLSQRKMAQLYSFNHNHFYRIENALVNPSFELVARICADADIDICDAIQKARNENT